MSLSLSSEQRNIQKIGPAMLQSLNILQLDVAGIANLIVEESKRNPAIELVEPKYSDGDKKTAFLESIKDRPSIEQYLLEQVPDWSQENKDILLEILCNLDEDGFCKEDLKKIAIKLHVPPEEVASVSEELKNLRPYGLSSKNLKEALIVQTRNVVSDPKVRAEITEIIERHLDDILSGFFKKIAKKEHLDLREVERVGRFILRLNFSPLSYFRSENIVAVIPDVRIFKREDRWIVEVNDFYYPQIRFSKVYKDSHFLDDTSKSYLKDCAKRVRILTNAINKRNLTLYNISCSILEHQKRFFEFGPKWINSLSLKEVADELGMNISTISRAVADKYIDTPFGTKKMSAFFEQNIDGVSATFIKNEIKNILKNKNLSDQKVADILNLRGIRIARRTIAKYRKEENLPNSRIRKIV